MFKKQIPTVVGIPIIVLLAGGVIGAIFFLHDTEEEIIVKENEGIIIDEEIKELEEDIDEEKLKEELSATEIVSYDLTDSGRVRFVEFWAEATCHGDYQYKVPEGFVLYGCVSGEVGSYDGCPTCEMSKISLEKKKEFCSSSIDYGTSGSLNGDTVFCDKTGALWTISISCYCRWEGTENLCDTLEYAGKKGWKLPNPYQLRNDFGISACGWNYYGDAVIPIVGGEGQSSCSPIWDIESYASHYWSSSKYKVYEHNYYYVWSVNFDSGLVSGGDKSNFGHVRCRHDNN